MPTRLLIFEDAGAVIEGPAVVGADSRLMARREKSLTPALTTLLEYVFHQTRPRRRGVTPA